MEIFIFFWILFAIIIGGVFKDKNVGFWAVFFISLLFSPLVGLIVGIASDKKRPQKVRTINQPPQNSIADELRKLKSLLDDETITQDEFDKQKEKLLN